MPLTGQAEGRKLFVYNTVAQTMSNAIMACKSPIIYTKAIETIYTMIQRQVLAPSCDIAEHMV
jgi:hypothetical protein